MTEGERRRPALHPAALLPHAHASLSPSRPAQLSCPLAMAVVDSQTVFMARVDELGLGAIKPKFSEYGWDTFADFAFATSDFKGSDPDLFAKEVIKPLVGDDVKLAPKLWRLFMQSYMLAAADLARSGQTAETTKITVA